MKGDWASAMSFDGSGWGIMAGLQGDLPGFWPVKVRSVCSVPLLPPVEP